MTVRRSLHHARMGALDRPDRPRLIAGLGLPLRALVERWGVVDAEIGKRFAVVYVLSGIGILASGFTALTSKTLALQRARRHARGLSHPAGR